MDRVVGRDPVAGDHQQLGAQVNAADQILAGQLIFLVILVVRPQGLTGRSAAA